MEEFGIVVAHFHPQGRVPTYLLNFLAYAKSQQAELVFVSTGLSDAGMKQVEQFYPVIRRENVGYDFWSYKLGLEALPERKRKRLWFLNSSFVMAHPALVWRQMLGRPTDQGLTGLTFSGERAPHVQSFCFLLEGEEFIQSAAVQQWWRAMLPISDREQVIQRYELGMSRYFQEHGFAVQAVYQPTDQEKLMAISRYLALGGSAFRPMIRDGQATWQLDWAGQLNPTFFMWDALFMKYGILKLEFLRKSLFVAQLPQLIQKGGHWAKLPVRELIYDALN